VEPYFDEPWDRRWQSVLETGQLPQGDTITVPFSVSRR